jgi:hypothetical protein
MQAARRRGAGLRVYRVITSLNRAAAYVASRAAAPVSPRAIGKHLRRAAAALVRSATGM